MHCLVRLCFTFCFFFFFFNDTAPTEIYTLSLYDALPIYSTVDDSFAKGIGRRLDGWPNRDLNVGAIAAMAPNLKPLADWLENDEHTIRQVLNSWGPGKYDAELDHDGKAFQPDGRSAATVLPAAFGLAGQNLHTYTGWGSIPYWEGYCGVVTTTA